MPIIIVFVVFYQTGAGSLPYLYISETCYDAGMSIGIFSMWIWTLMVSYFAPFLINNDNFGPAITFLALAIFTTLGFLFSTFVVKETKDLDDF